jgi:hypothetical protein
VLLGATDGLADCAEFRDGTPSLLLAAAEFTFLVSVSTRLLPEE